jgi:hypothetical protein
MMSATSLGLACLGGSLASAGGGALPQLNGASFLLVGLVAAFTGVVLIGTRRKLRRLNAQDGWQGAKSEYQSMSSRAQQRELEDAVIELDRLARQINAQLDTRFAKLETVVRDADERIDTLQRLLRQSQGESTLDVTVEASHGESDAAAGDARSHSAATGADSNAAESGGRGSRKRAGASSEDAPRDGAGSSRVSTPHATVHRLADEGLSAAEIARRVQQPVGEIELILALRRTQQRAPANMTAGSPA